MDQQGAEAARQMLAAQSPLTSTAILGLPGVAVPTGVLDGVPTGIQVVCARYQEHIALDAAEIIEGLAPPVAVIEPRTS
jgi:amidase